MASKTSQRSLVAAERRTKAFALRKQGFSYTQIARALGVHRSRVGQIIGGEIDRLNRETGEAAELVRTLELLRLDHLMCILWPIMENTKDEAPPVVVKDLADGTRLMKVGRGGKSNREMALMACDRILSVMERRAKYLGLDKLAEPDTLGGEILDRYERLLERVYGEPVPAESLQSGDAGDGEVGPGTD